MTDTPEDDKLIEALARAAYEGEEENPKPWEGIPWEMKDDYRWQAKRFLAMQREYEWALIEAEQARCNHDFHDFGNNTGLECINCGFRKDVT